jgi:hypothetical protein
MANLKDVPVQELLDELLSRIEAEMIRLQANIEAQEHEKKVKCIHLQNFCHSCHLSLLRIIGNESDTVSLRTKRKVRAKSRLASASVMANGGPEVALSPYRKIPINFPLTDNNSVILLA